MRRSPFQISLAKEIGENQGYQLYYLVTLRQIEAAQAVGVEQASALQSADIKIISTVGSPTEGLTSVQDIFSAKGATTVGAMMEAFKNTPTGAAIIEKMTAPPSEPPAARPNGRG